MTKVTIFLEKTDSKQAFLIQNVFGFSWKESQMVQMEFSSLLLALGGVTNCRLMCLPCPFQKRCF